MGLGGALFEAIEFDDGKILNPRFSRLPRAALQRRADARDRPARPQGPAVGRRGRDADRRHRPGGRQRHLPGHRRSAAVAADGAERVPVLMDCTSYAAFCVVFGSSF